MSSSASIMENIKPCNVAAWSYDISIQMLKDDISKLKKNPTQTNLEEIVKKENAITERKVALEKHCRQFNITYNKFGTHESEVKLEPTNGEVKAETNNDEAGVTNNEAKDTPTSSAKVPVVPSVEVAVPAAEINKMEIDSSVAPIDAATDAANAAALDDITFPPVADMISNETLSNDIHAPQPDQTLVNAQDLINQDFTFGNPVGATIDEAFITSPGKDVSAIGYFPLSPSSRAHDFASIGGLGDGHTPGRTHNDPLVAENSNYTTTGINAPTEDLPAQDGLGVFDGIYNSHDDIRDFGASAAPVHEARLKSDENEEMTVDTPVDEVESEIDEEDDEMAIDAPIVERAEVVIADENL